MGGNIKYVIRLVNLIQIRQDKSGLGFNLNGFRLKRVDSVRHDCLTGH